MGRDRSRDKKSRDRKRSRDKRRSSRDKTKSKHKSKSPPPRKIKSKSPPRKKEKIEDPKKKEKSQERKTCYALRASPWKLWGSNDASKYFYSNNRGTDIRLRKDSPGYFDVRTNCTSITIYSDARYRPDPEAVIKLTEAELAVFGNWIFTPEERVVTITNKGKDGMKLQLLPNGGWTFIGIKEKGMICDPIGRVQFDVPNDKIVEHVKANSDAEVPEAVAANLPVVPFFTHYDTLEISRDATEEQIRNARRDLLLAYHPDKTKNEADSAKKIAQITEACKVLLDPEKKKEYDEHLEASAINPAPAPVVSTPGQPTKNAVKNERRRLRDKAAAEYVMAQAAANAAKKDN
eukprot:NODE_4095_length_1231_cov_59.145307_g3599_i0.p1 GENE.NODE_4095_length_1231_cov_59.145307_g3599_i0~~NODE_4095_length_1231_cov_59.145307_g3599_i0.p1  ORF type:complete len:348 (-),score=81.52 NODE_4095_length_1231_cov_59.145307_g3599_i0:124-1167(-)